MHPSLHTDSEKYIVFSMITVKIAVEDREKNERDSGRLRQHLMHTMRS